MCSAIKLESNIKPSALKVAMGCRGVTKSKLCKNVKGISQSDLSKFLNGYYGCLSEEKLKDIMLFLEFPFEFLHKEFKPFKSSLKL